MPSLEDRVSVTSVPNERDPRKHDHVVLYEPDRGKPKEIYRADAGMTEPEPGIAALYVRMGFIAGMNQRTLEVTKRR